MPHLNDLVYEGNSRKCKSRQCTQTRSFVDLVQNVLFLLLAQASLQRVDRSAASSGNVKGLALAYIRVSTS